MIITGTHFNYYLVCRCKLWLNAVAGEPVDADNLVPTALINSWKWRCSTNILSLTGQQKWSGTWIIIFTNVLSLAEQQKWSGTWIVRGEQGMIFNLAWQQKWLEYEQSVSCWRNYVFILFWCRNIWNWPSRQGQDIGRKIDVLIKKVP